MTILMIENGKSQLDNRRTWVGSRCANRVVALTCLLMVMSNGAFANTLEQFRELFNDGHYEACLLYTSPSPRDATLSRMPSSA